MSPGERAVWAAAYGAEFARRLAGAATRGHELEEVATHAARTATLAVEALRELEPLDELERAAVKWARFNP